MSKADAPNNNLKTRRAPDPDTWPKLPRETDIIRCLSTVASLSCPPKKRTNWSNVWNGPRSDAGSCVGPRAGGDRSSCSSCGRGGLVLIPGGFPERATRCATRRRRTPGRSIGLFFLQNSAECAPAVLACSVAALLLCKKRVWTLAQHAHTAASPRGRRRAPHRPLVHHKFCRILHNARLCCTHVCFPLSRCLRRRIDRTRGAT